MKISSSNILKKMYEVIGVLIALVTVLAMTSCSKKFYFSQSDLEWFNQYEEGDILIFESISTGILDTSKINQREVFHNYIETSQAGYSGKCHIARLWYENEAISYSDNRETMFGLNKCSDNQKHIGRSLSFLESSFHLADDAQTITLNLELSDKDFDNVYELQAEEFKFSRNKNKAEKPVTLYWAEGYGIIKYVTREGEQWERINW